MLEKVNKYLINFTCVFLFVIIGFSSNAGTMLKDHFEDPDLWRYIADDVMGGVSQGQVDFETIDGSNVAILRGNVSTENNGGFIQIRRELKNINLNEAKFIKITAKGNDQKYFIFLRTTGTLLPWQYYSSHFEVTDQFKEFVLPIAEFKKSGVLMTSTVNPKNITSIGLVAFGRDHQANLYIKEVEFIKN
mgnify:CR=1 FL=1